jgi:hypothetical protein
VPRNVSDFAGITHNWGSVWVLRPGTRGLRIPDRHLPCRENNKKSAFLPTELVFLRKPRFSARGFPAGFLKPVGIFSDFKGFGVKKRQKSHTLNRFQKKVLTSAF